MAVPSSVTMNDVSGSYKMSKTLSDDIDQSLSLQGIESDLRAGIGVGSLTMNIKHYSSTSPPLLEMTVAGGKGYSESDTTLRLDDYPVGRSDMLFGKITRQIVERNVSEIDDPYLSEGWADGTVFEEVIENQEGGWVNRGCWGFQDIDGQRYYCRKARVTTPSDSATARIVYEYEPLS